MAEICARLDPFEPDCDGVLYASQAVTLTAAQEAESQRWATRHRINPETWRLRTIGRRLVDEGKLRVVSGEPLSSESLAPFQLDGRAYRSVWCFYQALKLPEEHPERAAIANGTGRRLGRPGGRTSFRYQGEEIAVNSVAHGVLVARATEAKVEAHEHVRQALLATGTARLYMADPDAQALGRYMPFALMVLRFRLTR